MNRDFYWEVHYVGKYLGAVPHQILSQYVDMLVAAKLIPSLSEILETGNHLEYRYVP